MPTVRAVECAVSNAADPRVGAPCPLVCLVCRPDGRPTFSCDPEAHALRERPSSAAAHAPGGASLYNGAMARLLGLSSAGMCLCWGGLRPSCERAAQPAHTQVRRTRTPRAVAFGYIYGGQRSNICEWPAPRPTVRPLAPAADPRHGRHERPASLPSLAFVVVSLAPLCICLHNAARRRDSSELGGAGAHRAGQGQVLAQF